MLGLIFALQSQAVKITLDNYLQEDTTKVVTTQRLAGMSLQQRIMASDSAYARLMNKAAQFPYIRELESKNLKQFIKTLKARGFRIEKREFEGVVEYGESVDMETGKREMVASDSFNAEIYVITDDAGNVLGILVRKITVVGVFPNQYTYENVAFHYGEEIKNEMGW